MHFSHLDNGLRIAWAKGVVPPQRVFLRLHVAVGSLMEEDHERGSTHLLEHMAFNGTRGHPAEDLVETLQRWGMRVGADVNARTGYEGTVYELDLPQGNEALLRDGLAVLRGFADGTLLREEDLEREKPVVDREEIARDSVGALVRRERIATELDGTLVPQRPPIGVRVVRKDIRAADLRKFYDEWYRPERMTVIIVGDLGQLNPEEAVRDVFGDLRGRGAAPAAVDVGKPKRIGHVYVVPRPEAAEVTLILARLEPFDAIDTVQEVSEAIIAGVVQRLTSRRLGDKQDEPGSAILGGNLGTHGMPGQLVQGVSMENRCEPDRWQEALLESVAVLRKAWEGGFDEEELDVVRTHLKGVTQERVRRLGTSRSSSLAGSLVAACQSSMIPIDPVYERELVRMVVDSLSPGACRAAMQRLWAEGEWNLVAVGPLDGGPDGVEALRRTFEEALAAPLDVTLADSATPDAGTHAAGIWAYDSSGVTPGPIVERTFVPAAGFHRILFANGVVARIKRTSYGQREVLAVVNIGTGREGRPQNAEALGALVDLFGGPIVMGAGLVAHDRRALALMMDQRAASLDFEMYPGQSQLRGSATTTTVDVLLEWCAATLEHCSWSERGLETVRDQIPRWRERLLKNHDGPLATEYLPEVHGGDGRYGLPDAADLLALSMHDVRGWLEPEFAQAALSISLVGDLDVETSVVALARTLGALPGREPAGAPSTPPCPRLVSAVHREYTIPSRAGYARVDVRWPLTDGLDLKRRLRLELLAAVLQDRLRKELREDLGLVYNPRAFSDLGDLIPGYGWLVVDTRCAPQEAERVVEVCRKVADEMARPIDHGVAGAGGAVGRITGEEVARLREPMAKKRRDMFQSNAGWLGYLSGMYTRPELGEEVRQIDSLLGKITPTELSALAARYLGTERASSAIVRPR